jgi:hypothetical protein
MKNKTLAQVSGVASVFCLVLGVYFGIKLDHWHSDLLFGGSCLWAISVLIFSSSKDQDESA